MALALTLALSVLALLTSLRSFIRPSQGSVLSVASDAIKVWWDI